MISPRPVATQGGGFCFGAAPRFAPRFASDHLPKHRINDFRGLAHLSINLMPVDPERVHVLGVAHHRLEQWFGRLYLWCNSALMLNQD
jgi:hypothetical protein